MFIRKISRKEKKTGKCYDEYRLVESVRTVDNKGQQRLRLNLGCGFKLPPSKWKWFTACIESILASQLELFALDDEIEPQAGYLRKKS